MPTRSCIFRNLISYIENTTYFIKKSPGFNLKPRGMKPIKSIRFGPTKKNKHISY